eukprot:3502067-Amphidinium_carterae.1
MAPFHISLEVQGPTESSTNRINPSLDIPATARANALHATASPPSPCHPEPINRGKSSHLFKYKKLTARAEAKQKTTHN